MIDEHGNVVHERLLPYPVERVWAAISERDAIAQWLMPNDFTPTAGARFRLDAGAPRGMIDAEVVDIDPPRRMVWRWLLDGVATTITITLRAVDGGTALHLVHADIPDDPKPRFESGWIEKFDALDARLKGAE